MNTENFPNDTHTHTHTQSSTKVLQNKVLYTELKKKNLQGVISVEGKKENETKTLRFGSWTLGRKRVQGIEVQDRGEREDLKD